MIIGICTEKLLQYPSDYTLTKNDIIETLNINIEMKDSDTTNIYLKHITNTRKKIDILIKEEKLEYDKEIYHESGLIIGHPDILTDSKVFEVKTSTLIKPQWSYMISQLVCYHIITGLDSYLVFPLQEYIYKLDSTKWKNKKEFSDILVETVKGRDIQRENRIKGKILTQEYHIGLHISREKIFYDTVKNLSPNYAWQMFLGSNLTTNIVPTDEDVAKTLDFVTNNNLKIFIHSPYTINLCTPMEKKDGYYIKMLETNLKYTKSMGFLGCVVHVGKHTSLTKEEGYINMINNVKLCLEYCSEECSLLLETPCKIGTELLTDCESFISFIEEINDKRLGVCVDTCHTYVSGILPSEYLQKLFDKNIIPKLIHFNDSEANFGSHRDLHANIGVGKIPLEELKKCAEMCFKYNIPMVKE